MALFVSALVATLFAATLVSSHRCIHDDLVNSENFHIVTGSQEYEHGGRRLDVSGFAPLRIKPVFVSLSADPLMTPSKITFLQNTLMPAAVSRWQSALSVQPVVGPLYAHRECTSAWNSFTPNLCSAFAPQTQCGNIGDGITINFGDSVFGADTLYASNGSPSQTFPAGEGLADADFGVFVTARATSLCSGGTLAYATTCQRDTFDRPTWARINFCPAGLSTVASSFNNQLYIAMHELNHALGFSSSSWPLWRNTDVARTPRTPRDAGDPTQVDDAYIATYTCGGGTQQAAVASLSTITYSSERGMTCGALSDFPDGIYPADSCVARVVTPHVAAVSRAFFGCPSLPGAELENHNPGCQIVGSHWEQRVFNSELMASYVAHSLLLSPVTLALHEDSGWYTANYSAADTFLPQSDYGFKQGCAYAKDSKCLTGSGEVPVGIGSPPHYYGSTRSTDSGNTICTTDRLAIARTTVVSYSTALSTQFQYFSTHSTYGGSLDAPDFCPYPAAYSNTRCWAPEDASASTQLMGMIFGGAGSMCFISTLTTVGSFYGSGCYSTSCVAVGGGWNLQVSVQPPGGGALVTVTCSSAGQTRSVSGFSGSLTCPDPAVVCAERQQYSDALGDFVAVSALSTIVSPTQTISSGASASPSRSFSVSASPSPSPVTASPSLTGTPSRTATPTVSGSSSGLRGAAAAAAAAWYDFSGLGFTITIVIIAVVGALLLFLLILLCCCCCGCCRSKKSEPPELTGPPGQVRHVPPPPPQARPRPAPSRPQSQTRPSGGPPGSTAPPSAPVYYADPGPQFHDPVYAAPGPGPSAPGPDYMYARSASFRQQGAAPTRPQQPSGQGQAPGNAPPRGQATSSQQRASALRQYQTAGTAPPGPRAYPPPYSQAAAAHGRTPSGRSFAAEDPMA